MGRYDIKNNNYFRICDFNEKGTNLKDDEQPATGTSGSELICLLKNGTNFKINLMSSARVLIISLSVHLSTCSNSFQDVSDTHCC